MNASLRSTGNLSVPAAVLRLSVASLLLLPGELGVDQADGVFLQHQLLLLLVQVPRALLRLLAPKADQPSCVAHLQLFEVTDSWLNK